MKNKYEIQGEATLIFLQNGLVTKIDTSDLFMANSIQNQWFANKRKGKYEPYVMAHLVGKGRKKVLLHRILTGAPKGMQVDHFDHDGLNNRRKSNLRVTTQSENQQNRKEAINKTGHRGVYPKGKGFKVEITVDKQRFYFGFYSELKLASMVASEARRRLMPFTQEPGQPNDDLWDELSRKYLKSA